MEVCRTCMNSSDSVTHIYAPLKKSEDEYKQLECVANILNELAGCKLISNDGLPQFVCESCTKKAKQALMFKRMIETSHRHFVAQQNEVYEAKTEIKVECEDLELSDICDMIDLEDLQAMENLQIKEQKPANINNTLANRRHCYKTRHKKISSFNDQDNSYGIRTRRKYYPPKRFLDSAVTNESITCPYCNFCSSTKGNLKIHIRTHTGERPYKCAHCPKAFVQKQALIVHIRTHTGERPIRCPTCSTGFRQSSHLVRHFQKYPNHKNYKNIQKIKNVNNIS